ncbi:MAG: SDR family oxidoreductase [Gemmatimonadota bacterium]|nr:SDR family oxidoreductase [Gemmatimonadota bacterium]
MTVTLITGASTGIGEATALHLARMGHTVYASMRTPDSCGDVLRAAAQEERLDLEVMRLDVDDSTSVASAVGDVMERSGRIDVLVNNAGILKLTSVEEAPLEEAKAVFETNVFGALRMMQAVLPEMREQGSGTIVNMSSVAGRLVSPGHGIYAATKYALEALSEAVAIETRRLGIRVIVIEPGFISTPILDKGGAVEVGDGPYAVHLKRMQSLYRNARGGADPPSAVAEVIADALDDPTRRFRYIAGKDAPPVLNGRARMTDEEWIDMGREMTDEEYFAESGRRFGADGGAGTE